LCTNKINLELRNKLVKCYIWNIVLCGDETRTVRAVEKKHVHNFEMWCCRKKDGEDQLERSCELMKNCYLESRSRVISYMK
jgi:hypothetical protein